MLLYSYAVTLGEVPNEVSLTLNISDCPFKCEGCHSKHLQEPLGVELTLDKLRNLIDKNKGITVVTFMGGDQCKEDLTYFLAWIKTQELKTCLYTGATNVSNKILNKLDFIKYGKYVEKLGGLESPGTNQMFLEVSTGKILNEWFQKRY
jgi:anaerobic ribonucleoside-triphosphate reductase activating protein